MIDLHCHLLPGIDDGPPDVEAAIAMARAQVAAGVQIVACTPHVDWSMPNGSAAIAAGIEDLRAALAEERIPLELVMGAEVGLTRAADTPDSELQALHLAGGPWLLLEAPLDATVGIDGIVRSIADRGHRILLAHPERCPAFHRDRAALAGLVAEGVRCQVTATALTGSFGRTVAGVAREMMSEGLIHVVSSDAHDAVRRPPGLEEHVQEAGFGVLSGWLTRDAPAAILAGERVPGPPALPAPAPSSARKRWWQRG